jgi:hypothetical protein
MTPAAESEIIHFNEGLDKTVDIELRVSKDERSDLFRRFSEKLSRLASRVNIREKTAGENPPGIWIQDNLSFHALPSGNELQPFLRTIRLSQRPLSLKPPDLQKRIAAAAIPVSLRLYITSSCPFCPQAVNQIAPLGLCKKSVRLAVLDGLLFSELANKDKIRSAPTLLLDEHYRFNGSLNLTEIVALIAWRNPARLSAKTWQDMIEQGGAQQVAQIMIDHQILFPSFYELVFHAKWPVRLGAMVVFEYLIERDALLAAQATDYLWKRYRWVSENIKGDILYLIGEIGDKRMISDIAAIKNNSASEDVKEAAAEALQKLVDRA